MPTSASVLAAESSSLRTSFAFLLKIWNIFRSFNLRRRFYSVLRQRLANQAVVTAFSQFPVVGSFPGFDVIRVHIEHERHHVLRRDELSSFYVIEKSFAGPGL